MRPPGRVPTLISVNTVTTPATRSRAERGSRTRGEPSSITGSRLSAGVFQSERRMMFLANDGTAGSRIGGPEQDAGAAPLVAGHESIGERGRAGRANTSTRMIAKAP